MNYYQRHIGDYAKDTSHLTLLEHGVYNVLLDWSYASEKPLPDTKIAIYRICRAFSAQEKQAVDAVIAEFFPEVDGVRVNKRADAEIAFCKEVNLQKRIGALLKNNPSWTREQAHEECMRTPQAPKKLSSSANTRARSNSQQPTAIFEGGGEPPFPEQATDTQVLEFAASWPGESASGTPKFTPEWVSAFLVKLNGRGAWPRDWRRWMISIWRAEWRTFTTGKVREPGKKNGALSANVDEINRQKKLRELQSEEAELVHDLAARRAGNLEMPSQKAERLKQVRREIQELNKFN